MSRLVEDTINAKVTQNESPRNNTLELSTSRWRTAPSFFILGAQKSGTSSLFQFLVENDFVASNKQKEIYYFNNLINFERGQKWYLSHFKLFGKKPTCDATANYFEAPEAPNRIKSIFPDTKCIILLRNPIDRAFSHYKMAVKYGYETLSFSEALQMEDARLQHEKDHLTSNKHNFVYQRLGYRTKGYYADQLKKWKLAFPSNEQLLVVKSENLFVDPSNTCRNILDFLGMDGTINFQLKNINESTLNSELSPHLRQELAEYYAPLNEELYDLIGENFNW
jgi:hypothetical protein